MRTEERESERVSACLCVCRCVCVREREREREYESLCRVCESEIESSKRVEKRSTFGGFIAGCLDLKLTLPTQPLRSIESRRQTIKTFLLFRQKKTFKYPS